MSNLRIVKGVLYPFAAVMQLVLVPNHWLGAVLAAALLGLATLNWIRLLQGRA